MATADQSEKGCHVVSRRQALNWHEFREKNDVRNHPEVKYDVQFENQSTTWPRARFDVNDGWIQDGSSEREQRNGPKDRTLRNTHNGHTKKAGSLAARTEPSPSPLPASPCRHQHQLNAMADLTSRIPRGWTLSLLLLLSTHRGIQAFAPQPRSMLVPHTFISFSRSPVPRPVLPKSSSSSSFLASTSSSASSASSSSTSAEFDAEAFLGASSRVFVTPEGYGFTAPVSRILQESGRQPGYYRAKASDAILDVQQAITRSNNNNNGEGASSASSQPDVALVFADDDDNQLLGLFTETDYIQVRRLSLSLSLRQVLDRRILRRLLLGRSSQSSHTLH